MNCPFTGNDWSALMDGELEESRRDAAMKHLQQCEHCSAEYQRLRDVNDRLAALQPPDPTRLLRSIAQLPERRNVVSPSTRPVKRWKSQFAMQAAGVLLAAATILLCIVCISAFSTENQAPLQTPIAQDTAAPQGSDAIAETAPQSPPVARLVAATGPIEIRPSKGKDWTQWDPDEGDSIPFGCSIRACAPAACAVQMPDQSKVRLSGGEIIVQEASKIEYVSGKVWCQSNDDPMQLQYRGSPVAFTCPSGSEAQIQTTKQALTMTCSGGGDGGTADGKMLTVRVSPNRPQSSGAASKAPQTVSSTTTQFDETQNAIQKLWQLPLLVSSQHGRVHQPGQVQEAFSLIEMALSKTANESLSRDFVQGIRESGGEGGHVLLGYVADERSRKQPLQRQQLMRLAVSLRPFNAEALLRQLRADEDHTIAALAHSAYGPMLKARVFP